MTRLLCSVALLAGLVCAAPAHAQSYNYNPNIELPSSQAALVRTLLSNPSWKRRAAAAESLGQIGDSRVLEALATAAANDTEPEVRRAASAAIRAIRGNLPNDNNGFFPRPQPQQDPNVALVDSWYQRYLGRSLDRSGMGWVAQLNRGMQPIDALSGILASDEFWKNNGRSPEGYVRGMYATVLKRVPSRGEVANWLQRYGIHRGARVVVAKEFLEAAQTELLGRGKNDPISGW